MGNWYEIIVDRDATEAEAPRVAERMRRWLAERKVIELTPRLRFLNMKVYRPGPAYQSTLKEPNPSPDTVKGLKFVVGRTVFLSVDLSLTCEACKARFEVDGDEALARWHEAVDA